VRPGHLLAKRRDPLQPGIQSRREGRLSPQQDRVRLAGTEFAPSAQQCGAVSKISFGGIPASTTRDRGKTFKYAITPIRGGGPKNLALQREAETTISVTL
jgi:hypothetical protein